VKRLKWLWVRIPPGCRITVVSLKIY
jgi:hypothetical protein